MKYEEIIKVGFAGVATLITELLGGWDMALKILIFMIIADYLTGVARAFCLNQLSSEIGAKGIVKKVMILIIVMVAAQLDKLLNTQSELCRTVVIYFYIANEGLSLTENLAQAGVPLPKILVDKLQQLQGDTKEGEKDA